MSILHTILPSPCVRYAPPSQTRRYYSTRFHEHYLNLYLVKVLREDIMASHIFKLSPPGSINFDTFLRRKKKRKLKFRKMFLSFFFICQKTVIVGKWIKYVVHTCIVIHKIYKFIIIHTKRTSGVPTDFSSD